MPIIDTATWEEVFVEADRSLDKTRESVAKYGRPDTFKVTRTNAGGHELFVASHIDPHSAVRKAIARDITTGELKRAKILKGNKVKITSAPRIWARLEGKSAAEIVKITDLTGFFVLLSVSSAKAA